MSQLVKKVLHATGLKKGLVYSNFDEQKIIRRICSALPLKHKYCVDIAAGDGFHMSNTIDLFQSGWAGLAVEFDAKKFKKLAALYSPFPEAQLFKTKVTPANVVSLFDGAEVPKDFGFLNLDIDSYDYFVLEQILSAYRPLLICAEINEKIPPPLKFTVKYDPAFSWDESHFYGQSLSMLMELAKKKKYALVEVEYNNAFLVPQEHAGKFKSLSAQEGYQLGYSGKKDRLARMPWNKDMEPLQGMKPAEALRFINGYFKKYAGRYTCKL
jgi:hypothetical protein